MVLRSEASIMGCSGVAGVGCDKVGEQFAAIWGLQRL